MFKISRSRGAQAFGSRRFTLAPSLPHLKGLFCRAKSLPRVLKDQPLGGQHQHQHRIMSSHCSPSSHLSSHPLPRRTTPFAVGEELRGDSGMMYKIEEVISHRTEPFLCVYRASDNQAKSYIIKNLMPGHFEYRYELQQSLKTCSNLRTMVDAIPDQELLIYPFLADTLLRVSQKELSMDVRKGMVKSALTGLAELHDRGIVHTDIKPNNILVDYEEGPNGSVTIKDVKISDLEDAIQLKPEQNLLGCRFGNQLWRSPESWLRARQNTPSDIFSFAITAIYVMRDVMVFLVPEVVDGQEAWQAILTRHVSYFGDNDGFQGFLEHVGEDNAMFFAFIEVAVQVKPRTPFSLWDYLDLEFRDLITKMTNLDPNKRITAREALEHKWFTGVE